MERMTPFEIILSGPGKNAMSSSLMRTIIEQLREASSRPVLLTGAGDSFSAGLDLKEVSSLDAEAMDGFQELLSEVVAQLYHYPAPTVACVNGHAIAGGCVLALCCDFRVATDNPRARLGLNEVAIGARFPPRILNVVQRRLPARHADRVLLGGALCDPTTAFELGLVDEVAADPLSRARERLAALAAHAPDSYAAVKARMRPSTAPTDEQLATWRAEDLPAWTAPAFKSTLDKMLRK